MIVLWASLFLLHQGYSLVPVISVQLNNPVTFNCVLPDGEWKSKVVFWYKQNAGEKLTLIATQRKFTNTTFGPEFSDSRVEVKDEKDKSSLIILRTSHEDEGMYHCAVLDYNNIKWTGMYLSIRENTPKTLNYSVVQSSSVSGPVRPGDSVSLQCSVLSDSNKTCPGGPSIYWIRTGSDKSGPGIIYTDVNDECEQGSDSVKSCVYHFSKNISSSDAGTYHCAVASCGHILFGNGTKLIMNQKTLEVIYLVILAVCLIISIIVNIVFIYYRRLTGQLLKGSKTASLQATHINSRQPEHDNDEGGHELNYAALYFSKGKTQRGRKKKEWKDEESVYAQMKS